MNLRTPTDAEIAKAKVLFFSWSDTQYAFQEGARWALQFIEAANPSDTNLAFIAKERAAARRSQPAATGRGRIGRQQPLKAGMSARRKPVAAEWTSRTIFRVVKAALNRRPRAVRGAVRRRKARKA